MRIKIDNKRVIRYERTVGGIKRLVAEISRQGIPDNASIDWRQFNVAELVWSAEENGLYASEGGD